MGGSATAPLATAVASAGGLGFIGADLSPSQLDVQLTLAASTLSALPGPSSTTTNHLLLGVGFLLFLPATLDDFLPVLKKHRPAILWLFAARELKDYGTWATILKRELGRETQVWVQVGSVRAAREVVRGGNVNVLVVQGADAGGHGMVRGAGVVSLVPEVVDALGEEGFGDVPVVAAGGIADGRAAAAVLASGAQGVVLGTRFLAARETAIHGEYRRAVIAADDGGESTRRSKLFDNLRGENIWPVEYDGRSVIMESFVDYENGVGIEEIRKKHKAAVQGQDGGFGVGGKGRTAMWAGTGVGLVRKEQDAAEIVEEVRQGAVEAIKTARSRL